MKVCVACSAAAAALMSLAVPAHSQEAGAPGPVELPEVVVTTASPVVKPSKKKAKAAAPAPSAPAQTAPGPELLPLPGAIVDADGLFVPVTVTTDRELLADGGATLTDTLQTKPGISGTTFAPGANRPIIRGLDSYRVRTQENGIGTHDVAALSEDHAVPVDPLSASRVEVVRGPATLRYGSQAMGGVVAVENERIPTYVPPKGLSAEIVGGLSSVDDGADAAFSVTGGAGGVAVHADAFRRNADDYESPLGTVRNSFVESEGGSVGGSIIGSDGFVGLAYSRFESLYGVPGEEAEEGVDPRIDLVQDKVLARGEWRVRSGGIDALRFWFGASDYAHSELAKHEHAHEGEEEHEEEEEHGEEDFSLGSRFTNREQEARIEVQHTPFLSALGELSGAVGVQFDNRRTRGQSFEGDSLLEPAHTTSLAAFWFEELALTRLLRFQAAARAEETRVDGTGWSDVSDPEDPVLFAGERVFRPLSGSVGVLYDLPYATVVRLTGQYVERAPDAAELFSKGMHEATGTFEIGNPFLEKERATTIEAGLKRATGTLRYDASAYYTRYKSFIYRQLTGVECGTFLTECGEHEEEEEEEGHEHESFDQVFFQQRDATFYGAELSAQLDIGRVWNGIWGLDAQYDFVRAKFAGGENVPRIPPHRLGGGVYYHDAQWFARAGLLHAFDQDEFGVNEIATPGYTLVSAEVSYTTDLEPTNGAVPQLTIGLRGENLADDEVLNHASFKRSENVLLPGASVRLFGSVKLN